MNSVALCALQNASNEDGRVEEVLSHQSGLDVFQEPALTLVDRAPFGTRAGTAAELEPLASLQTPSTTGFVIFVVASMCVAVFLVWTAWRASRLETSTDATVRAWTLGAKLTAGFGVVALMLLCVGAFSLRQSVRAASTLSEVVDAAAEVEALTVVRREVGSARFAIAEFIAHERATDLVAYSNAMANMSAALKRAEGAIEETELRTAMTSLATSANRFEEKLAEVVGQVDRRNGIIQSQMTPVAAAANDAIEAVIAQESSGAGTDHGSRALALAAIDERFLEARFAFFRYLRSGQASDAELAQIAARDASQAARNIISKEGGEHETRLVAMLTAFANRANFYAGRIAEVVKTQGMIDGAVNDALQVIGPHLRSSTEERMARLSAKRELVVAQASAESRTSTMLTASLSGVCVPIAITFAMWLTGSIVKPIALVVARIRRIADGDLTGEEIIVRSHDEIGQMTRATNEMTVSLTSLVGEVQSGTSQIEAGTRQISSASQSLAEGASRQAASLQQISASMEEMASKIAQNAGSATRVREISVHSKQSADQGQGEMRDMARAMEEITASSGEVAKIIKVIDEIAFQTNLLALNAAVEAARALGLDCGPMGGFDKAKVDTEFFAGTPLRSLLLCNLGYGEPSKLHPRLPRLSFAETCRIV